jgi:hypothetical protein
METFVVGQIKQFHMIYQLLQVGFYKQKKILLWFIYNSIIDTNDRTTIIKAMNQLMFDVGTPIPGQSVRQVCVYFRPSQSTDKEVVKIQYGNGCSASVSQREVILRKSIILFR